MTYKNAQTPTDVKNCGVFPSHEHEATRAYIAKKKKINTTLEDHIKEFQS